MLVEMTILPQHRQHMFFLEEVRVVMRQSDVELLLKEERGVQTSVDHTNFFKCQKDANLSQEVMAKQNQYNGTIAKNGDIFLTIVHRLLRRNKEALAKIEQA